MIIKLEHSLKHGNKTIEELEVTQPFMKIIRQLGSPVRINQRTGEMDFNYEVCCRYLEILNALPPSVINQLTYQDFMRCINPLMDFFKDGGSSQMTA